MNNLDVYNKLRVFHSEIKGMFQYEISNDKSNAIEALNCILYMAESIFALDEELTD